jgi:hypothetical protein
MPHANYENLIQSQLYAEFLPNIRSVSVSGRLSSSVDFQTEAAVINEGSSILIRHASSTVYMPLPVNVIPSQIPSLQAGGTAESHNITIRLQPEQDSLRALLELGDENHDPWNAVVLRDSKAISCAACGSNVVLIEAIKSWKDLPSANWAEMMDFWHCHKPHNGPSNTTGKNVDIENKGYSASNTFSAAPGTGFVDTTSLVLNPMDCQSVKVCHIFKSDMMYADNKKETLPTPVKQWLGFRYKCPILKDTLREDCALSFVQADGLPLSSPLYRCLCI